MPLRPYEPACEQCGYELGGLVGTGDLGACPECGAEFDPLAPWKPERWPSRVGLVFKMCGPAIAIAVFLVICGASATLREVVGRWGVIINSALVASVLFWPSAFAQVLVKYREPRATRRAMTWKLAVSAVAINVAAVIGMVLCLRALI